MSDLTGWTKLENVIKSEIDQSPDRSISFYRWMELCLYHPEYGYYMKPGIKVGKEGDFYTVSSLGTIFAEQLIFTFNEMIRNMGIQRVTVLEWGGGEGRLSEQMISLWREDPFLSKVEVGWVMLELSPDHKQKQRELLGDVAGNIPIRWIPNMSELSSEERQSLIVFSNELLDAFPVYRIKKTEEGVQEMRVAWSEDLLQFEYKLMPANEKLLNYLITYEVKLEEGQEAEINLDLENWARQVASHMEKGYVVTVDYGDVTESLYSSMRPEGTLVAYYKHRATNDVLSRPGAQDLTSHVHFSACMEQGARMGMETVALLTQRDFLLNSGVINKLSEHQETDPFRSDAIRRNRVIRQLLMPGGISDSFKVLIQSKGVCEPGRLTCLFDYFESISES
jgi:SAM-dependent MidA family methyltransferase